MPAGSPSTRHLSVPSPTGSTHGSGGGIYQDSSTPREVPPGDDADDDNEHVVVEEGLYSQPIASVGGPIIPAAQSTIHKKPPKWIPQFKFILFTMAFNVVIFVVEIGQNGWTVESMKVNPLIGPSADVLLSMGAQRTDLILNGGWWRLLTAMFLHAGVLHIFFNMTALYQLGIELEATFDRRRIVFIYFVTGLLGGICSAVFVPDVVNVGASGAIFGLFGATFAEYIVNWELYTNHCCHMTNLIVVALVNLGIGLLPYVNNFAHLGGFLSGFGLGLALLALPLTRQDRILNTRTPKQRLYGRVGGTFTFLFGLLFIVLLGNHTNATEACPWCKYLDCIPSPWWSCDSSAGGQCYGEQFTNGTLIITCPSGQNLTAPLGSSFTAATCTSVCNL
ncbi:Aste57867_13552 [Aphanomyces stellatus]|uniref:rhomboid protease n=1 Tax=Aphanomyces stellatus TaxID=120398 RepID=A0A485L0L9_9STRA|nr:hypothetical protein As57867_013502 [Aphanomyces stellatus]VFT90390.1 Aste57867_13552 [Aphanomyces stellatus]